MKADSLRNGIYLPGSKLPGDEELCEEFGVSAITLKKALEMLAESGHVKRVPGKGTYVEKREKAGTKGRKEGTGHLLGLVLEHVSTPFGLEMMYQMDRIAQKAGYRLIVRFSYGDREKEREYLSSGIVEGGASISPRTETALVSDDQHGAYELLFTADL